MIRHQIEARPQWHDRLAGCGIGYSSPANRVDWNETACYEICQWEADAIYEITKEIYALMVEATDRLFELQDFSKFDLPFSLAQPLTSAWEHADYLPTFFTRFDFEWGKNRPPYLVGIVCDTPSLLLESSVGQWEWAQERVPWALQFNTIEERLLSLWKEYRYQGRQVHIGYNAGELDQYLTAEYLQRLAVEAGVDAKVLPYSEICYSSESDLFIDTQGKTIQLLINIGKPNALGGINILNAHGYDSICISEPLWKEIWKSPRWLNHLQETSIHRALRNKENHVTNEKSRLFCSSWVIAGEACGIAMTEQTLNRKSVKTEFIPHLLAS